MCHLCLGTLELLLCNLSRLLHHPPDALVHLLFLLQLVFIKPGALENRNF